MWNELVFLITVAGVFGYILLCFVFGRRWLYASIVINLLLIGVFGAKLVSLFGGVTNVGNIFYVAVFFAGQLLVEHYGKSEAKKSVWIGLFAIAFFILMGQLTIAFRPVPESLAAAETLNTLFGFAPQIALGSLLAYLCSQTINIRLYSFLSKKRPNEIWLRSLVAGTAGQFLDSVIFFSIAFWGTPLSILVGIAATGFAVKSAVGILSIPCIYLSYRFNTRKDVLEQEYEAMLEGIGEGIVVSDKEGRVLTVNKMFEKLVGWQAKEVIGKKTINVLPRENEAGKSIPVGERMLTQILSGEKEEGLAANHTYFRRKDGTRFPVKIAVTPIKIDGKIMGAIELFSDVTEEKKLENMRRDFLALASHQLRTPLSSTRWVIETLLKGIVGELNEKQKEYIFQLYMVNAQMSKLASDTLGILRMESGNVPIQKKKIEVADFYQMLIAAFDAMAKKQAVTIQSKAVPGMIIETDLSLAQNIMGSLLANAIEYSNRDTIITLDYMEDTDKVTLIVKDQGIGIPIDEQAKIFERFYRASNAKDLRVDGTGLGLTISQMLAEKIGANITFESTEGKGSTFYVHVPK
jgi:uncharacterized integral membrane protein (TIGR00697 family)